MAVKIFLSEMQNKLSQGNISYQFLGLLIKGLPILKERDVSLGPETPIELMVRRILEEKLKIE